MRERKCDGMFYFKIIINYVISRYKKFFDLCDKNIANWQLKQLNKKKFSTLKLLIIMFTEAKKSFWWSESGSEG